MESFENAVHFLLVAVCILIFIMLVSSSIYACVIYKYDAYIMIKLPDGSIVEGDGSYRNISEKTCKVCIDGIWYKTSYQNIVIMTKK